VVNELLGQGRKREEVGRLFNTGGRGKERDFFLAEDTACGAWASVCGLGALNKGGLGVRPRVAVGGGAF